jgi:hypothetical protein
VAAIVRGLPAALLERKKLVSKIDERHRVVYAAKAKVKQATVKRQSCDDVGDLDSNAIETHRARLCC